MTIISTEAIKRPIWILHILSFLSFVFYSIKATARTFARGVFVFIILSLPYGGLQWINSDNHRHVISIIYDRWNHSQAPHKQPPHLSYTQTAGHDFLTCTSSPYSTPVEIKTQWNGITYMQITFPKVPPSKTIQDQLRPFRYFLSCDYLCIFQQARPNHGYNVIGPILFAFIVVSAKDLEKTVKLK